MGAAVMVLGELARVVRSKNAGPTLLTIDVLFTDRSDFLRGEKALALGEIARIYRCLESDVQVIPIPLIHAIKIVLPRHPPAGSPGDRDAYGAQQHAPLLELKL